MNTVDALIDALSPSEWDCGAIKMIFRSVAGESHQAKLAYRSMKREADVDDDRADLPTGALSGTELKKAQADSVPTFFLLRQSDPLPCWKNDRFFYPTIVFPKSMPNHVYNDTEA